MLTLRKLYVCAVPVQPDDLTAKARIREAALAMFAADGFSGTSMRSIAARAGVSPSLVVHHFGTKTRLRDAVDDAVLDAFTSALKSVDPGGTPLEVSDRLNTAVTSVIGEQASVREYLGRSLVEATESSQRLFDTLAETITDGLATLERRGVVRSGTDPTWRAHAVLFLILGPVLLGRPIETRLRMDPFDPDIVSARSASHIDLLQHGLFVSTPPPR